MKQNKLLRSCFYYALLFVFLVWSILPILTVVGTSFKTEADSLATFSIFPAFGRWTLDAYRSVFAGSNFLRNIANSLMLSLAVTLVCTALISMAGYGMSRFRGPFFKAFEILIILIMTFPPMLLLIPTYLLYASLKLVNSLGGIFVVYLAMCTGFNIMMMRSFMDTIPRELDEAAMLDGCTGFKIFWKIIFPAAIPGIISIAIMIFLSVWNEYMWANLLLRNAEIKTISLGLAAFSNSVKTDYTKIMAGSTVALLPAFAFLLFAQKYLVQGLTSGAVKS